MQNCKELFLFIFEGVICFFCAILRKANFQILAQKTAVKQKDMGITRNSCCFFVENYCPVLHHHSCTHLPARCADDKLVIADPAGADGVFSDVIPDSFFIHRKPEVLS